MLTYQLVRVLNGFYRYEIYIEGNPDDVAVFEFNPETKEVGEKSDPESGYPSSWLSHFMHSVFDDNGKLKDHGWTGWY